MRTSEKYRLAAIVTVVLSGGVWVDSVLAFPPPGGGPGTGEPGGCTGCLATVACQIEGGWAFAQDCLEEGCETPRECTTCSADCDPAPSVVALCLIDGQECPE